MAYVIKTAEAKPAVTTDTTLYQATAAKQLTVASIRIVSMVDTGDQIVKIARSATATPAATEWIFRGKISPFKPIQLSGDLVNGGQFIVVHNETAGGVVFSLSAWESV